MFCMFHVAGLCKRKLRLREAELGIGASVLGDTETFQSEVVADSTLDFEDADPACISRL